MPQHPTSLISTIAEVHGTIVLLMGKKKGSHTLKVSDVSVEVATVDSKLAKPLNHRRPKRKTKLRKKYRKKFNPWNFQNVAALSIVLVVFFVISMWTLLWYFVLRPENSSVVFFAALFRIANVEFIPEYRQKESREFASMAQNIEVVVNNVYRKSAVSKMYKHSVLSDLSSNNDGGILVYIWMIFVVPKAKKQYACEDCVGVILKDSIQTSLVNRTSVGYLYDLPVDFDSIVVNAATKSDYISTGSEFKCSNDLYAEQQGVNIYLSATASSGKTNCHIKLFALPGFLIHLSIESIDIEANDCVEDALIVYDSLMPIRSKVLYKICEPFNSSTMSFVSTGNVMYLSFKASLGKKGFTGNFAAIPQERCSNILATQNALDYEGYIKSPYFPSFYPPKCNCTWGFRTPRTNLGIALKFYNYELKEKGLKGCDHGWWKINEKMYCGSYVDYQTIFYIASSKSEIEFQCSSKLSDPAFKAQYASYNINKPCPGDHFLCSTGLCIEISQRCNGVDDCNDESDEVFCSTPLKVCDSSNYQHPYFACNGIRDCEDGADEMNCTMVVPCTNITYKCKNNMCIRKRNAKCDGVSDCLDNSDESNCGCGSKSQGKSRIVGGANADDAEWPWQVSLHFSGTLYCGASVISKEWLLSAAHCFGTEKLSDPRPWLAYLGMRVQGNPKFFSEIRRIVVHEYYNSRSFDYDIALLQLKNTWPKSLSSVIQPICIPSIIQSVQSGDKCWVTGWGKKSEGDSESPSILQEAEVEIVSQTVCRMRYGPLSSRMICAGVASGKKDACRGDSGGPLSCPEKSGGKWFLIGIVSWGVGCGRPNLPGVYTRVSKFASWIQNYVV
ncbi:transmembrane protease serine 7 [Erpetoichthys calabaricus]|uniref:transmembrane protease serine 7 n=1 Tax=Erpetoichthys calabaricus TaxID=27687 RepID=UPI002234AAC1|nr:transmembrane protease serine 7 [Erpetoichthys calabaricus]